MANTSHVQAPAKKARIAIPSSICVLLYIVLAAALSSPAPVQGDTPPSEITVYLFGNLSTPGTYATVVPGYNGSPAAPGFGSISVFQYDLRLVEDIEAPIVGEYVGELITLRGNSIYIDAAFDLQTPSYTGIITMQFKGALLTSGEGVLTGGTGDFRYAKGYADFEFISTENLQAIVFSSTFHLEYD